MSGLLACPFCGSKNVKAFAYGQNIGGEPDAFFQCQDCTVTGPNGLNEAEAITAWNRRAPAAPVDALTDAAIDEIFVAHMKVRALPNYKEFARAIEARIKYQRESAS